MHRHAIRPYLTAIVMLKLAKVERYTKEKNVSYANYKEKVISRKLKCNATRQQGKEQGKMPSMSQSWKLEEELSSLFSRVKKEQRRLAYQGLRRIWKLNKGALDLYVSNVNCTAVDAIGSFDLIIPEALHNEGDWDLINYLDSYIVMYVAHLEPRLEKSATRMLNMVPTKKVDKSPYEIWHGKVPNLSYLMVWGCENSLISQEASGSTVVFDEIQRQDAQPFDNTDEHQPEVEHEDVEPQTNVNPFRRSVRIPQAHE
ncbi:hypothetical protein Tco_0734802 [Tanacetum coccineum]